jgi:hypothetical protein
MTVAGIRYARRFYTGHIHIEYASLLAFFSPDFKRTFYSAFVKLDVLFYPEAATKAVHPRPCPRGKGAGLLGSQES